ncbi:8-oxo-dGTP diphosphatase [Flavobacteriaceae bacterium UJ101]|nr:8-oxo-dGTP diphosphatase [Flavobacteriaceae bacterium UJ101]
MRNVFKYCPNCQSENTTFENDHLFTCHDCHFIYYHNVATAVATIIKNNGRILFSVRNNEPMKGKLDLPGGFVDPGETAEEAVKRELKEELNLDIQHLDFFTTDQNTYFFKGITYRTCDVCYITEIDDTHFSIDPEEIQEIKWLKPDEIKLEDIGFDSLRRVVKKYLDSQ